MAVFSYFLNFSRVAKQTRPLTEAKKERAIALYRYINSYRETVAALRRQKIYISKSDLQKIVARVRKTGSLRPKQRSGRPRKTTRKEDQLLCSLARRNRSEDLSSLGELLEMQGVARLSRQSISRRLSRAGYARRPAAKVPFLNQEQRERRLEFATAHVKAGLTYWGRLVFTDEKMLVSGGQPTRPLITRKSTERYASNCVVPTRKRPLQIHIWGAIFKNAMGPLRLIEGNLNALKYQQEILFDVGDLCQIGAHPRGHGLIFQQDNAPAHAARSTRQFLAARRVPVLDWPGNSPDFNPIENVWAHLSRRVHARGVARNKAELWEWAQEEWDLTPVTLLHSIYNSLPQRMQEALDNNGGPTHY